MVWPTSWSGVAIGWNVRLELAKRSNAGVRPVRFAYSVQRRTSVLEWLPPTAQYPRNFLNASLHPRPGGRYALSHVAGFVQLLEFDLARLPERVEATCQAIHKHRVQKGHTLTAEERKELDDALRVLFTLMQRAA